MFVQLRRAALALVPLWGALAGCPSGPGAPALALGTGAEEFEPLEAGDVVLVVLGPQGSYHIDGSLRVAGIEAGDPLDLADPRNPTITFSVEHEGASVLDLDPITQGLEEAAAGAAPFTHELIGRRLMLSIADDAELDGEDLALGVTVQDADGVELSASVNVLGAPHPMNL